MGRIYKNAICVLAWLGEGGQTIPKAFAECKVFVDRAKEYHIGLEDIDSYFKAPKLKVPSPDGENELKVLNIAYLTRDDIQQLRSTF
jgi:hypothetical protein